MYIVLIANCDSRTGPIRINGHSEWMNPYGELFPRRRTFRTVASVLIPIPILHRG